MSPLPESVSATLRSDPTAALAALMVITAAHAELFAWAARFVCADDAPGGASKSPAPPKRKGNGAEPHRRLLKPAPRKPSNSVDAYLALRREARDRDDESLLEAMRETPEGAIGDWAEAIGKSRSSVVTALHRLRDAGLADSVDGKWTLVEEPAPRVAAPKWVAPLSAAARAQV
jgi:DNA-binding transcriptional ArsR family regulator